MLGARQALEEAHAFRYHADLPFYFDRILGKIHAQELHAAGSRREQARQDLDRRRFPRAIRSQKSEELSGCHLEINAVDRSEVPESPGQLLRLNGHFRHGDSLSAGSRVECKTLARVVLVLGQWADAEVVSRRLLTRGRSGAEL